MRRRESVPTIVARCGLAVIAAGGPQFGAVGGYLQRVRRAAGPRRADDPLGAEIDGQDRSRQAIANVQLCGVTADRQSVGTQFGGNEVDLHHRVRVDDRERDSISGRPGWGRRRSLESAPRRLRSVAGRRQAEARGPSPPPVCVAQLHPRRSCFGVAVVGDTVHPHLQLTCTRGR